MTTTYELYTNENGTPKAVEGKAPAIVERVEALEGTLNNGVVTSINGNTGEVTPEQTGCLPLSGGMMTGSIQLSGQSEFAKRDVNDSDLVIFGGTSAENGAYLQVTGKDSWGGGEFWIVAKGSTGKKELLGKPDGTLKWGDKEVERVNAVTMEGGMGTGVDAQICIRYESGVQICCGETGNLQNTTQTYKMPFLKTPCVVCSIDSYDPTGRTVTTETTTTTISVYKMSVNGGWWFAMGQWK